MRNFKFTTSQTEAVKKAIEICEKKQNLVYAFKANTAYVVNIDEVRKSEKASYFKANFAVASLGHKVAELMPDSGLNPFEMDYDCLKSAFQKASLKMDSATEYVVSVL